MMRIYVLSNIFLFIAVILVPLGGVIGLVVYVLRRFRKDKISTPIDSFKIPFPNKNPVINWLFIGLLSLIFIIIAWISPAVLQGLHIIDSPSTPPLYAK